MKPMNKTQITRLAGRFPALEEAQGIWPWNPNQLDIWAAEITGDQEAVMAARFLLSIWNRNTGWQCGRFDALEAREIWTRSHLLAFLEWMGRETDADYRTAA